MWIGKRGKFYNREVHYVAKGRSGFGLSLIITTLNDKLLSTDVGYVGGVMFYDRSLAGSFNGS